MPAEQALWINDNASKFSNLFVSYSRERKREGPTHSKLARFTVILQVLMEQAT